MSVTIGPPKSSACYKTYQYLNFKILMFVPPGVPRKLLMIIFTDEPKNLWDILKMMGLGP